MKKNTGRIVIIVVLVIGFIMTYTIADAALGNQEIQFGYWVNLDSKNDVKNFVVLGTDKDETRTDLILFCQYQEKSNLLNVIQIPRDTQIETSRLDKKINSSYGTGDIAIVKSDIETITGIYPDNYIVVNFKGFRKLIDAVGGIDFDIPIRMYYTDPVQNLVIDLKPGWQNLNGKEAEMFMRFRKNNDGSGYTEGDIGRLKAHKSFYRAVAEKVLSLDGVINIGKIMETVGNNLKTDFTLSDLIEHIDDLKNIDINKVNIVMLPGKSEYINGISYYISDKNQTKKLTNEYFKFTK